MFSVIIVVSAISLLILLSLAYFGFLLHRIRRFPNGLLEEILHVWMRNRPPDPSLISNALDEYLSRRNEFWTLYGQFILSAFVIVCVTILLLTRVISAEAGLPILSGVGGFAIGKGISAGRSTTYRRPEG
ncbi:MAG: hypothetical protein AMJ41_00240 [candidate division Zixibacteria bacterium DG_27]|nr:MAG: hypothetical protein AMJ41_00240 [candidate division Zixibacteria bacterium DG_27]